ncbi:deoxyuridine 5'-triphosphate nucleotidohydrolase [Calocera viscosa TUFC12733]|uniref:Deoxyuridine 5'-triphosphate nucleotidohydrolase n=1 Tax=Calocera viscosa (strain TUFC12733) TaxID=1330018 RepID=A0A167QHB1_CALVF|nr:deoxyuridine 5'-triphosphate nucleotidohydrolase [Calocera viscosa TUFC12733]
MILPGRTVAARGIVRALRSEKSQVQPCGVDLSLKRVLEWTSAGTIDFSNQHRQTASTRELRFQDERLHLPLGAYLVEFNELVATPADMFGQLFVRSSLFRSGALLSAGVCDAGYEGAIGGLLQVCNPHGITLYRDAKLAQFVFHQMTEKVEGYSGVYQGSKTV